MNGRAVLAIIVIGCSGLEMVKKPFKVNV